MNKCKRILLVYITVIFFLVFVAPSEGPKNVRVVSLSAFNVTVVWGNITEGKRNGIIQKYKIEIKKDNSFLSSICCVLVNETRIAIFPILQPAKKYTVYVCGYTSHHKRGAWASVGFHSTALRKYIYRKFPVFLSSYRNTFFLAFDQSAPVFLKGYFLYIYIYIYICIIL